MSSGSYPTIPGSGERYPLDTKRRSHWPSGISRGPVWVIGLLATCFLWPQVVRGHEEREGEGTLGSPRPLTIASPAPQPALGERLSFHGRWLGIPVGHGWLEVKELVTVEGRRAYHLEAQGHSNRLLSAFYPIHDVVHSYLDADTLKPLRFEKQQQEGHYRADEIVTFDHASGVATYRSLLSQSVKTVGFPPDVQDLISALYWFRAQPLHPQTTASLNLYSDEKVYETAIEIGPPLLLELLKRGTFPCVVVEPKASFKGLLVKRGRLWAYVTVDERRLPLLVKITTPWGPMSAVLDEESLRQAP